MSSRVKKIMRRLRSFAGESLTETLVAMLIASLAIVMLAGMISSAVRMVASSKQLVAEYTAAENALVEHTGESAAAGTVTLTENGTLVALSDSSGTSVAVTCYENSTASGITVYSYKAG